MGEKTSYLLIIMSIRRARVAKPSSVPCVVWVRACVYVSVHLCMCLCVCVREREREGGVAYSE